MILLCSLAVDAALLTAKTVRGRKLTVFLRFLALSALINSYAFFMTSGLEGAFGEHLLLSLICAASAKIFVFRLYLQPGTPKRGCAPLYLTVLLLALLPRPDLLSGLLGSTVLLLYLLYAEKWEDNPLEEAPAAECGQESALYLRTVEDSYRKNRALMHDLKNHITAIRSLAENKEYDRLLEYTDSVSEKISENLFPVRSGNIVLDALLADKYQTARRNKIYVEFLAVRCADAFDASDLCAVVGNLLDNAIAENLKTARAEDRRISVSVRTAGEELTVEIKNPLFHTLKLHNGLPVSDKPDLEHHGIGLKNVRRICDSYGGTLVWDDADGIFTVTAHLKMTRNP